MNPIDVVAVLLLVAATVAGLRTGALPQLGGIAGAVGGFATALAIAPWAVARLDDLEPFPRALVVLAGILVLVGIGEMAGSALGRALGNALGRGVLSALDRVAGAAVGGAQAVLVIWLAGGLLALGPVPALAGAAHTSTALRVLSGYLPPPTEIVGEVATALDASGLPEVFVGLEPVPLAPVDRPSDPVANAIAALVQQSVPRISAAACGATLSGTGWVAGDGYVVTAAHVVAGSTTVRVTAAQGTLDAVVVLFDPRLDIAVMRVPGLVAPALRLADADPERGAIGVTLGYPGGGSLDIIPSAVAGTYPARGRDIYGRETLTRDILELRARVDRGDSGGPFVLQDGTVGGLVFAESRSDPDVGYALAPSEAAPVVAHGRALTTAVDTGACIR